MLELNDHVHAAHEVSMRIDRRQHQTDKVQCEEDPFAKNQLRSCQRVAIQSSALVESKCLCIAKRKADFK